MYNAFSAGGPELDCESVIVVHMYCFLRFVIQVEGNLAGAGDALMLDCEGFVSETNATNIVSV